VNGDRTPETVRAIQSAVLGLLVAVWIGGVATAQPPAPPGQAPTETVTVTKTVTERAPRPEPRTRTVTVSGGTETVYSEGRTVTETTTTPGRTRVEEVSAVDTGDVVAVGIGVLGVGLLLIGAWLIARTRTSTGVSDDPSDN
jgi:multidrug efflux pump subunit AcrA (membrane-fusion protein)